MKRLFSAEFHARRIIPAALLTAILLPVIPESAEAQVQFRRVPIRQSEADRRTTNLNREEGAVYLEGLVQKEMRVKITSASGVYSTLKGDRWLGNLLPNQEATLLAISEKAYRVRARAKQGQVAGWVGKHAVEGVDPKMEENLTKLFERQILVEDLIANRQVALGMTANEVMQSLGEPDQRNSKVDRDGQSGSFDYITYDRVPQFTTAIDQFGRPFRTTTYVNVETGRATISFDKGVVSSIEESEGAPRIAGAQIRTIPAPIPLF